MSVLTNRHFGHTEGQTRQVSQRAMSSGRGRGKGALRGDGGAGGGTAQQLRRSIATGGVPGSAPRSNAAENRAPARAPTHGRLPDMADEDEPARSDQEHGAGRPRAKRETNASKLARSVHEADDRAHERYMQAMDALQPVVTDRKAPGYRASMQHLARQLAEEFVWSNNMYGTATQFDAVLHTSAADIGLWRVANAEASVQWLLKGANIHHRVLSPGQDQCTRVGASFNTFVGHQAQYARWVPLAVQKAMFCEGWHPFRTQSLADTPFCRKPQEMQFGKALDKHKRSTWHVYLAAALADCKALGEVSIIMHISV